MTDGVYRADTSLTPGAALSNCVVITNDITIHSANGPEFTVIECAGITGTGAVRGVYAEQGRLEGFTIRHGGTRADGDEVLDRSGGGILALGG